MDPADRRFFESLREAPLAGDILLHFHGSTFDGRPRTPSDLPNQVALLYRLIEHFGPNQVVGVPAFVLDDPLGSSVASRVLFPETLHSCLALPYILRFILIHWVPESSLPPLDFFPEVVKRDRSGWVGRSFDFRWPVFQRCGRFSNGTGRVHPFTPLPKNGTHPAGFYLTEPLTVKGLF